MPTSEADCSQEATNTGEAPLLSGEISQLVLAAESFNKSGSKDLSAGCYIRLLELLSVTEGFEELKGRVLNQLGCVLRDLGRSEDALRTLLKGVHLMPNSVELWVNLGAALRSTGRVADALKAYARALVLDPMSAMAFNNLGNAYKDLKRFPEAVHCFSRAVEIQPDFALAYNNLGAALCQLGRGAEAILNFQKAIEHDSKFQEAFSNLLLAVNSQFGHTPETLFEAHREFDRRFGTPHRSAWKPHDNCIQPERLIRLGFISGDMGDHPVAYFCQPIFEHLCRQEFNISVFYNGTCEDLVTGHLRSLVDGWFPVFGLSDCQAAEMIRAKQIDILVDLSGHTALNRLGIFARKAAPVQVTMIGFMQTTGLESMDYRVTSDVMDPAGTSERFNTEQLVRIPLLAPFNPFVRFPEVNEAPSLGAGFVTFGSFNSLSKVGTHVMDAWAAILSRTLDSRMIIVGRAGNSVRDYLKNKGIDPTRIDAIEYVPKQEFPRLHHRVDLILDTFPYTGGTTSYYAVKMGVPIVSLAGFGGPSRFGAAILNSLGVPELVAESVDEYVQKAFELSKDADRLVRYRKILRARLQEALGDGSRYVEFLGAAFREMWRRWCDTNKCA